jgi:plasmid stability protein
MFLHDQRCSMPRTLKVENVEDEVVERLSHQAARHGRSLESEHRAILLKGLDMEISPFDLLAEKMRKLLEGRRHTPSEVLLRESREER